MIDENNDDVICPECEGNISLREKDKKKRFEDFHKVQLAEIRKKEKKKWAIISALVMMAFCGILLYFGSLLPPPSIIAWWVFYFKILAVLIYGIAGAFMGSLNHSPSKEEKNLWESFK